jgi:hypothetical protein
MQTQYNKIKELYNHLGYVLPDGNINLAKSIRLHRAFLIEDETTEMVNAPNLQNLLHELTDILTLTLGTAAMAGFTANQLQMAMELVTDANMRKTVVDGVITKPEGWQPADLGPCFFLEKDYPEYWKAYNWHRFNNGKNFEPPKHEIGYRYVKFNEVIGFNSEKYNIYESFWEPFQYIIETKVYYNSNLYRVPANHPITIQP